MVRVLDEGGKERQRRQGWHFVLFVTSDLEVPSHMYV